MEPEKWTIAKSTNQHQVLLTVNPHKQKRDCTKTLFLFSLVSRSAASINSSGSDPSFRMKVEGVTHVSEVIRKNFILTIVWRLEINTSSFSLCTCLFVIANPVVLVLSVAINHYRDRPVGISSVCKQNGPFQNSATVIMCCKTIARSIYIASKQDFYNRLAIEQQKTMQ